MSKDKEQYTGVFPHPCPLEKLLAGIVSQAITRKIIYAILKLLFT